MEFGGIVLLFVLEFIKTFINKLTFSGICNLLFFIRCILLFSLSGYTKEELINFYTCECLQKCLLASSVYFESYKKDKNNQNVAVTSVIKLFWVVSIFDFLNLSKIDLRLNL